MVHVGYENGSDGCDGYYDTIMRGVPRWDRSGLFIETYVRMSSNNVMIDVLGCIRT